MNEILSHDIKLLGLVMSHGDEFCSYFTELPDHFIKCTNFRDLYRLKSRKRKETKDNLEINVGLDILIYDYQVKQYFYRTLKEYTDMNKMLRYFKDGNLYVLKEELRPKEEIPEEESPEPQARKESDENDFLLF